MKTNTEKITLLTDMQKLGIEGMRIVQKSRNNFLKMIPAFLILILVTLFANEYINFSLFHEPTLSVIKGFIFFILIFGPIGLALNIFLFYKTTEILREEKKCILNSGINPEQLNYLMEKK